MVRIFPSKQLTERKSYNIVTLRTFCIHETSINKRISLDIKEMGLSNKEEPVEVRKLYKDIYEAIEKKVRVLDNKEEVKKYNKAVMELLEEKKREIFNESTWWLATAFTQGNSYLR